MGTQTLKFENLLLIIQNIYLQKNNNKTLENQPKILEKSLDEDDNLSNYNSIKNKLDVIYNHITESIHIRNKCV